MQSDSFAGQQYLSGGQSKRPSLLLTIPQSKQIFDVDLGSPFDANPYTSRRLSTAIPVISPKTATPFSQRTATIISPNTATATSVFFDWDKATTTTESSVDDNDDEGEAQIITIAPGTTFYNPPPPLTCPTPSFATLTFGCGALDGSRSTKSPAQLFHEQLTRMIRINDKAIIFDVDCLEEMETQLLVSPVDAFSELCMESTRKSIYSPQQQTVWRALPDVPDDFEPLDEDLEEMIEDFEDEDYSSDEAITPLGQSTFTVSLDKRLVAPFNFEADISNRYSVTPSRTLLCGLFS